MSEIYDQYEYLKKFWIEFYGYLSPNEEIDDMIENLENQLHQKKRRKLIRLIDRMNLECEKISLESFISGFRVAMGIAREVSYEAKFLDKD